MKARQAARVAAPAASEIDLHVERVACALALASEARDAADARNRRDAVEAAIAARPEARLRELVQRFGLTALEADALSLLWVLAYRAPWRQACADAAGEPYLGALAVARLFGHPPAARLSSESPLLLWEFVHEDEQSDGGAALVADPHAIAWLDGTHELDRALVGWARVQPAPAPLASWPVDAVAAQVRESLAAGRRVRVVVTGADDTARAGCAAAVAHASGLRLARLGAHVLDAEPARRFVRAQRQAFLDGSALAWSATDATPPWPRTVAWFPLQFVLGETHDARPPLAPDVVDVDVELRAPDVAERRALWRQAIPESAAWSAAARDELAQRYVAQVGEILSVAAANPPSASAAAALLLERTRGDLGPFAQRLERPFTWDDLVLPEPLHEALADVAYEARERTAFWAQSEVRRLFAQGRAMAALFCGPPGTGKTMAAQVIAGELGLDLYRVDLSAVLSKWVGETAQNLQRILTRASERNCILFFDEADALYGKRVEDVRDAQDRFANMDVSHLMVAIENFDGLVLLATNLKANIDGAFLRRIRHCLEFPRPDEAARRKIWERLLRTIFGAATSSALAGDLKRLCRIEATGAQLKNACLSAAFVARRRGQDATGRILVAALDRELSKDGHGLSPREIASWNAEQGDE